jgi:hypothetical protein
MTQFREQETDIIRAIELAVDERNDKAEDDPIHWDRHKAAAKNLERLAADFAAHDYDPALMARYAEHSQGLSIRAQIPYFSSAVTPDELLAQILNQ